MWSDTLNQYGLTGPVPKAQASPLAVSSQYNTGAFSGAMVGGALTSSLQVGDATNADSRIYLDANGLYAGSAVFGAAPFSLDMTGKATFQSASGKLTISAVNDNIIVNDGFNDRILIGRQTNGF